MTAGAFGGGPSLQWRAARVTAQPAAKPGPPLPNRGRVSRARWVDPNVRAVAYDLPNPRLAQQSDGGALFGDQLLKEFAQPMGKQEEPRPEELPPKAPAIDTLPVDDPPVLEPPAIDAGPDAGAADPGFDPFSEPTPPDVEAAAPANREGFPPSGPGSESQRPRPRSKELRDDEKRAEERSEAAQDCAEELAKLRASSLATVDITIDRSGVEGEDFPYICSIDDGIPLSPRCWAPITYTWKASALCHKPLYFEQEQLERYGHSWGPVMQPVVSGAHFFGHLMVLPYSMGLKAPNECVYALGHYRPGNCAPYLLPAVPFTWRAAAFQGGFATGAAFLIP